MNGMRKLFGFLLASVFAAIASPSSAVDKVFTLSAATYDNSPTPVSLGGVIPNGSTSIVLLDFFNQSPTGNSVINSIKVNVPADVTFSIISSKTVNGGGSKCPAPTQTTNTPSGGASPISMNNITGAKPNGHFCLYLAVTSTSNVCAPAQWTGFANTGNSFNGVPFSDFNNPNNAFATTQTYDGCDGILNCGDQIGNTGDPVLDGVAHSGLIRGDNTGGPSCVPVPYTFDYATLNGQTVSFLAIKGSQQPSVEYLQVWAPVAIPGSGWPDFRPSVSWGTVGSNPPVVGSSDYILALACQSDELTNPTAIMPVIPNVPPYSTALYSQYQPGTDPLTGLPRKAKMCIAEHGWVSIGGGMIQYWDRIIDQSDGWASGP